jgi:HAD superfamily hydrolase (TIGR01450 family)
MIAKAALAGSMAAAVGLLYLWRTRARKTKWLRTEDLERLVDRYDTWLLDCDGVIWLGEEAVAGVPETLAELRRRGKRIFFVSNNASKHRSTYLTKFQRMGIEASVEDVATSAIASAQFCLRRYGKGAKVYVCGTSDLIKEFTEVGLTVVEPKYVLDTSTSTSGPALVGDDLDCDIKAVVAAADWTLTHRKLSYATVCLTSIPGCELIATNRDRLLAGDQSATREACLTSHMALGVAVLPCLRLTRRAPPLRPRRQAVPRGGRDSGRA